MSGDKGATFGKRIFSVVTNGYLSLGLALGAELGLFKAMSTFDIPASPAEIAHKAECKDRYVREWLGMMTAGAVVETSDGGERFFLPVEHRETLLSQLVDEFSVFIPKLSSSHAHLTAAFKRDGPQGIPYEVNAPLLADWQKDRDKTMANNLPGILQLIPGICDQLEHGVTVCDIGCGQGHLIHWLKNKYPKSIITGIDVNKDSLAYAKQICQEKHEKVELYEYDAASLPADWANKFNLVIMYDVLHDIPHASKACTEFYRILKPGGKLVVVDINVSSDPGKNKNNTNAIMVFPFSLYNCMSTSLSVEGSEGLGACAGVEKLASLLQQGGFSDTDAYDLAKGNIAPGLVLFTASKPSSVSSNI